MKLRSIFAIFNDTLNSFTGQREGEEVVALLRRHPFTIYIRLGLFGLAALVPIFGFLIFYSYIKNGGWLELYLLGTSLWYLALWFGAFHALTLYTLSTVIITNKRIIDSTQHGLFDREVGELHSNRIQDVIVHTEGLIETFLKFGDVTVQTAGSEKEFVFHQIPHPEMVKDVITQLAAAHHTGIKPSGKPLPKPDPFGL